MKMIRYLLLIVPLAALLLADLLAPMELLYRFLFPLMLCALLCVLRIIIDVTAPERTVSIDILGIIILGICGVLAILTGKSFYMDIAIAWALQSFIGVLALAKYLEGRTLDD